MALKQTLAMQPAARQSLLKALPDDAAPGSRFSIRRIGIAFSRSVAHTARPLLQLTLASHVHGEAGGTKKEMAKCASLIGLVLRMHPTPIA